MYLGDFAEDGDLFFKFTTRAFATGIPTTLAGTPVLSVYKDEGGAATEKTTAEAYFDLDVDHDSIAGWNNVRIDMSGDAFFATGADYSIVITTGTVDSVNVFGENIANFSIENRSMGQPAGATLAADVAAIKAETALIVADTDVIDDGTSGLVKIASDVAAILVDTGTTLQAELDGIQADTENIQTRLPIALVNSRMDSTIDATGMEAGAIDAILDLAAGVETNRTLRQALRLILSAAAGKLSGAATTTVTIRDTNDGTDRIVATVDSDGNRSAVTLDTS